MTFVTDYLQYRIPGEPVVLKAGMFQPVSKNETPEGFVISTFEGDQVFQFVEGVHDGSSQLISSPEETLKVSYMHSAREFVNKLQSEGGKAVLSRVKKADCPDDIPEYFEALCEAYPNAFVYTFLSTNIGAWIGATPETLLSTDRGLGKTMALAGTRITGSQIDWTEKEFEEHEFVADFIHQTLSNVGVSSVLRSPREILKSGPVEHLHTGFQFNLKLSFEWKVAKTLHPTPAVSGWPVEKSLQLINQHELHDRSFYAGIIGVIGNKTSLFVNLRCAQLTGEDMFLYLGGGFTKDSDPEAEWEETENKAKTLLDVLKKT